MRSHVVRRGESLSVIAHRFGTTWQELARLNSLTDPNRIRIGQTLQVPGGIPENPLIPAQIHPQRPKPPQKRPSAPSDAGTAVAGGVTEAQLWAIMPLAGSRTARYLSPLNAAMQAHGINTHERRAAFLAQVSVETMQLHSVVENLNYSASRLPQVWPRRFRNGETARRYAHNPEALGNYVYADRLGNGDAASGDGYRYRGRGLIMTTGRANYRAAGFENNPEALANPTIAADSAGRFWSSNGLNRLTTTRLGRLQFDAVSRIVNGGNHGSKERWDAYQRALKALR